jgi:hypothetical protein
MKISDTALEDKIQQLQNKIDKLNYLKPIKDYFTKVRYYQNSYVVEMRRQIATKLFSRGYTNAEICLVLLKDHGTILNLMTSFCDDAISAEVAKNLDNWIFGDMVPITYTVWVESSIHKTKKRSTVSYKLEKL